MLSARLAQLVEHTTNREVSGSTPEASTKHIYKLGGAMIKVILRTAHRAHPRGYAGDDGSRSPWLSIDDLPLWDGQPVRCETIQDDVGCPQWAILRVYCISGKQYFSFGDVKPPFGDMKSYGKTWAAYPGVYDGGINWGGRPTRILSRAIDRFGERKQVNKANEELSELMKELCKHLDGSGNVEHIAEEIADVLIMVQQMIMIFRCGELVETDIKNKIDRLDRRVSELNDSIGLNR